jgi:transposase
MMGQREVGQGQFFYAFDLDRVVPPDHLVRQIDVVLDLSWVHKELAPYYSHTGRPSIDPVLMIRMLIIGYVFAIRSERAICAELNRRRRGHASQSYGGDRHHGDHAGARQALF